MKRSARRFVAIVAIVGFAFAQTAAATAACAQRLAGDLQSAAVASSATPAAHGGHCGAADPAPASLAGNLCEVHCSDGAGPTFAVDLPPVALVSLPVPSIPSAVLPGGVGSNHARLAALAAAPPPQLLYARFLI